MPRKKKLTHKEKILKLKKELKKRLKMKDCDYCEKFRSNEFLHCINCGKMFGT